MSEERFDRVENELHGIKTRLDRVEHRLDGVDSRLGRVETRLDRIEISHEGLSDQLKLLAEAQQMFAERMEARFAQHASDIRSDLRLFLRAELQAQLDNHETRIGILERQPQAGQ